MEPNTTCEFCEEEIYKKLYTIKNSKKHFCDRKCNSDYKKKHSTRTKENCDQCDKEIYRTNQQKRSSVSGLFFCDKTCGNRYKSKAMHE